MGRYVNPGNEGFGQVVRGSYVDKTGLISLFDSTLETSEKLVMVSRPRRFGKSFAAQSLAAFYSCGCDSRSLFEGLEVSRHGGWDEHLNAYNVLQLDMAGVMQAATGADAVAAVADAVLPELRGLAPGAGSGAVSRRSEVASALWDAVRATGRKFVFVIDVWRILSMSLLLGSGSRDANAANNNGLSYLLTSGKALRRSHPASIANSYTPQYSNAYESPLESLPTV